MTDQQTKKTARAETGNSLAGKHVVVTGGGRGIGAAIAARLAAMGAGLTLMGRDETVLAATAEPLRAATRTVDVTDAASVEAAFAAAVEDRGAIDILVNNAGAAESAPFHRTDLDLWRAMLDVNLTGVYLCTRQALPGMIEAGDGRVINIASSAGLVGYGYVTAYCAAKHGVIGLTRALAQETAKKGVTVNAVCPGYTETDMVERSVANIVEKTGGSEDEARAQLAIHNPQGRLIQPTEVADAVAWLALPGSASITGQSIVVAGGEIM